MSVPDFITKLTQPIHRQLFYVVKCYGGYESGYIHGSFADLIGHIGDANIVYMRHVVVGDKLNEYLYKTLPRQNGAYTCTENEIVQAIATILPDLTNTYYVKVIRRMAAIIDSEECRQFVAANIDHST